MTSRHGEVVSQVGRASRTSASGISEPGARGPGTGELLWPDGVGPGSPGGPHSAQWSRQEPAVRVRLGHPHLDMTHSRKVRQA